MDKCAVALYLVNYSNTTYYSMLMESDREHLSLVSSDTKQTHRCEFKGDSAWSPDIYIHFRRLFDMFEVTSVEDIPLYPKHNVEEIWAMVKGEMWEINEAYENIKE